MLLLLVDVYFDWVNDVVWGCLLYIGGKLICVLIIIDSGVLGIEFVNCCVDVDWIEGIVVWFMFGESFDIVMVGVGFIVGCRV